MSLTIRKEFAPVKPGVNCTGYGNGKKFITVHQTGNTSRGANAAMHAKLQFNNPRDASWHYQADDKEAVQSFIHDVKCWHASDGSNGDGNANSIAIESCVNSDGNYVQTIKNTAALTAHIMKQEGIPLSNVKQHNHWARDHKNCPTQLRGGKDGITWDKFLQMVQNEFNLLSGKPAVEGAQVSEPAAPVKDTGIVKTYAEHAVFTPNDTIIVRDAPSTTGNEIARYKAGESVIYHIVHMGNGYVWLQYNRAGGGQGYIPCRTYNNGKTGELWGKISDTAPASKPLKTYVQLSKNVSSWRIYPLGVSPVAGKEKGFLNPAKFGGLVYEVEGYEDNGKTAIIRTGDFGKGKIYLDSDAKVFKQ